MDRPVVPFRQFVLKMHSRCDLACDHCYIDHCYIYEHADTSWKGRPKASSGEVLTRTAERIAEHAGSHGPWTVALEDTHPQRDSHHWPVADRLRDAEFAAWRQALRQAWRFTAEELPGYADGLAAGLAAVTPLRPGPPGKDVSAAARQAFGAVGIARPGRDRLLAQLLVHEFQHVKLGAVLDFHDLFDPQDERLFYAPWRPDPRPLEMLLQGAYAHLAVTEFWRAVLRAPGPDPEAARQAAFSFAYWRCCTAEAVESLAGSGSLTELGLRFAVGLRERVAPWLDEQVEPGALVAARDSVERTRTEWLAHAGEVAAVAAGAGAVPR